MLKLRPDLHETESFAFGLLVAAQYVPCCVEGVAAPGAAAQAQNSPGLFYGFAGRLVMVAALAASAFAQTYRGKIGVEIEEADEGSRSRAFIDLGHVIRPWTLPDGSGVASVDVNGWPKSDGSTVFFDIRPIPLWAPPIDDPTQFQPDWSGTYHLSFTGQATLTGYDRSGVSVANQNFDEAINITTADVIVKPGAGLLTMTFTNTKRTPSSAANTGITNVRLIRPGYAPDSSQSYTNEFLDSLAAFSAIRFMGFTQTNDSNPPYPVVTNWSDRHVMSDATQQSYGSKHGAAWEYVILLANQTGKDIWINVPVAATDDYIRQLALLLHAKLNPALNIYIEHSNEVWNPLFAQNAYNAAATQAEIAAGGSPLNSDGTADINVLGARRHARRLVEISNIFKSVYGAPATNRKVRTVFAWWTIFPDQYTDALQWVKQTFGPPSQFFYALAQTHYFNDSRASANGSIADVLAAMRADSDSGVLLTEQLHAVAGNFGLKQVVYEGGPDNGGGSTVNVGNRILANRDPGMKHLVEHDIRNNWFDHAGDLYMYFTLSGAYSRYGCWGLTEDILNLNAVKFQAIDNLSSPPSQPSINAAGVVNAASGATSFAPGSFVTIYGQNFSNLAYTWDWAIPDGKTLPTMVADVRVRINQKDAYVSYVSPTQINALAPPDTSAGPVPIEVITGSGKVSAIANMAPVVPGFFTYQLAGKLYLSAEFAGETSTIYVAAAGALAGVQSRPAKPGDNLELFAQGLGETETPYPVGRVLSQPYPVAALSEVSVTVDGLPAAVQFAGMTYAGVFQINIQVPQLTRDGDLPVVLSVRGQSTQANALLSFHR